MHWSTAQKRARCAHTRLLKRAPLVTFRRYGRKVTRHAGREPKKEIKISCGRKERKSLLYLLPSADGALPQAPLATSSQTRPRFHLGSKDAFREETFERFLETFLPYAGGGGERPAAKCVATFFNRRVHCTKQWQLTSKARTMRAYKTATTPPRLVILF